MNEQKERVAATRRELCKSYLVTPPRNDDELHQFIRVATGFDIPRRAVCPEHRAPFEMIADLFFQRVTHAIGFASRGAGKTLCMAILDLCEQVFKRGIETIHFGAIMAQAQAGYQYYRQFLLQNPILKELVDGDILISETRLKNGNSLKIVPLTMQQASSPHVPIIAIDELDKIERWEDFQQALSIPMTKGDNQASVRITSTRDKPHGFMNRLLEEAEERNYTIFEWCTLEVLKTCPKDKRCRRCPAVRGCLGSAKSLPPGGWKEVQDLINAYCTLDHETFQAQWFNKKPSSDLLIYGSSWDDARNLCDPHDVPLDAILYRTIDFGQRNPTVILWAYYDGEYYVFYDEFMATGLPASMLGPKIREIEGTRSWHQKVFRSRYEDEITNYADPSGAPYITELRRANFSVRPARNDLLGGISSVRAGLESGKIKFMKGRCDQAVKQMKRYQWQKTPEGKPLIEAPLKVDDHFPDAVRYLVYSKQQMHYSVTGVQARF